MPFAPPRRITSLILAVVAGLVCDASFPGLGLWPLSLVAVALLFIAFGRDSARWNFLVGLTFGLAFFLPHLTWIQGSVGEIPWAALSLVEAAFVGLVGAAWAWARRGAVIWSARRLQVPAFALIWVAAEEARQVLPFGGFPWGRLAFAHADSPLGRWAWAGGAPLVSLLVVVGGVIVAFALLALRRIDVGAASGYLIVAAALVGSGWLLPLGSAPDAGRLEVGAVQGNVPDRGLDSFQQAREVLDNHVAGTYALLDVVAPGDLDLVVWPENGSDIDPTVDEAAGAAVQGAARALDAPLLVGTQEFPADGGRLNMSQLWDPELGVVDRYAKQHPAPFAEYVPMRDVARRFSDAVDRVSTDMVPGQGVGLIELESPRLGRTVGLADVICFEVAYDGIVRDAVQAGGEVLLVQTNNATFGRSDESTQQLAMSRLRAMEHGRATIQISTVGVSGVITPNGVLTQTTGLFTAEQMVASLPLRTELTPATRYGDAIAWVLRVLGPITVVAGIAGARRIPRADRLAAADAPRTAQRVR
ncbi:MULTISPECIES: apolipoprotein N-acyltransferase [unclassified Actinotalea]|uniref:apolipoprotein N-acyltransferase n=1 Tax=unclassified Actinotalea TaxID=2638618 RepID=UPI002105FC8B|nr:MULTISPECIES: apolipoprotein N-acyltransferase [unclassified Actinotalea]